MGAIVAHVCHLLHSIPISFDSKAAATQEDEGDLIERNLLPIIAFCECSTHIAQKI